MYTSAQFQKVSFEVFEASCKNLCPQIPHDEIVEAYEQIKLPVRATKGSAGYDFFSPMTTEIGKGDSFIFPTGIRCKMEEGWVLMIFPRSGMGFKTGMHLANTVGVIDQDYYFSDNEGHILVKLVNDSSLGKDITVRRGEAICQGVLLPFGIAEDDRASGIRNGGFGSTGRTKKR